MTEQQIRFDDGAAYERMMGVWSQLAGEQFLEWLDPSGDQRWIDVGCGNGAFTELIVQRCARPAWRAWIQPRGNWLLHAHGRPLGSPSSSKATQWPSLKPTSLSMLP